MTQSKKLCTVKGGVLTDLLSLKNDMPLSDVSKESLRHRCNFIRGQEGIHPVSAKFIMQVITPANIFCKTL